MSQVTRETYNQAFGHALHDYGIDRFIDLEKENAEFDNEMLGKISQVTNSEESLTFISQTRRLMQRWNEEYAREVIGYCRE